MRAAGDGKGSEGHEREGEREQRRGQEEKRGGTGGLEERSGEVREEQRGRGSVVWPRFAAAMRWFVRACAGQPV